jgi:hypothetical protein
MEHKAPKLEVITPRRFLTLKVDGNLHFLILKEKTELMVKAKILMEEQLKLMQITGLP